MNFNFQRHVRTAGAVVTIIGVFLTNVPLMIFGNLIMLFGYLFTIQKIETYLEAQSEPKEEDDAIR